MCSSTFGARVKASGGGSLSGIGMGKKVFLHSYEEIISMENLLEAWQEFSLGKTSKKDVEEFAFDLMANLFSLHDRLVAMTYRHESYEAFTVFDPKTRSIHKASVIDRVLHRAVYRKLYPFFDRTFIADSFSCRVGKGTHKALDRFRTFAGKASHNHQKTAWVLKCDIRKFFASIDHAVLIEIVDSRIADKRIVSLLGEIIGSFEANKPGVGLPLGNLTSQLLANVYMNEFDQFVKHFLQVKYYVRYADDFVFLSYDRLFLEAVLSLVTQFLQQRLRLTLHPD